jgi:DNA polymerase III subunit delta
MADQSSLFLFCGDDEFLIDQAAKARVEALCPETERAFGLEVIEATEDDTEKAVQALGQCLEAVQTVGFFGGRKVVWLRGAVCFADSRLGKTEAVKAAVERLTELIKRGLPEGQVLVISALQVDGRRAFFKACKAAGAVEEFKTASKPKEAAQATRARVSEVWAELGLRPAAGAVMEQFLDRVGTDTRQIVNESVKLSTYLGAGTHAVKAADVEAVTASARASMAWDLADHVAKREVGAALRTLRQLLFQREQPIGLLMGLEGRFRELLVLKDCLRRKVLFVEKDGWKSTPVWAPDEEAEAMLSGLSKDPRQQHPYRTVLMIEQAQRYSLRELLQAQLELARAHETLISSAMPAPLLLELLVLRLAGRNAPAAKAS